MTRRAFLMTSAAVMAQTPFRWPEGKRGAISLSFDDARLSQVDVGIPFLDKHGVKATFYVLPRAYRQRLEGWKKALAAGHEVGHHTNSHPCTANYAFSKTNALEDFTLARLGDDLDTATTDIEKTFGVKPVSFAYPCGQKFVGRGTSVQSYVPLIARRFTTGRGYLDEAANDPSVCDVAALMGTGLDGLTFAEMKRHGEAALKEGRWLIFAGHEMGAQGRQTTDLGELAQFIAWTKDSANGVWLDTVGRIAEYVRKQRG